MFKKEEEKYSSNIGQWFKPTKDILQSMVGENIEMEIDQVKDIERKLVRINGESSDEDSKEDEGSSKDNSSSENKELVEKEGIISTNTRDAIIIED